MRGAIYAVLASLVLLASPGRAAPLSGDSVRPDEPGRYGGGGGGEPSTRVYGGASLARRLQEGNATNMTGPLLSACMQAAEDTVGAEQCEINYRKADCPDADGNNWVAWTTLDGPFVMVHIFGVLVMFMSLSVVCDEYFVPGA
jgi:hypothetical protein